VNPNRARSPAILLAVVIAAIPSVAFAQPKISVPIMLGGNDDYDACPSAGIVSGLDPRGDGFLSVRGGPGRGYPEIDRVYNDNAVQICERRGGWMAVVYGGARCGVSSPWPKRRAYTGPCKFGWVSSRYVTVTAG
jgi:hypothetical protein